MDYLQLHFGPGMPIGMVIGIIVGMLTIGIAVMLVGRSIAIAVGSFFITTVLVAAFILFVKGPLSYHDENVGLVEHSYGVKTSDFINKDSGLSKSTLSDFVSSPPWSGTDSHEYTYATKGAKMDVTVSIDWNGRLRIVGPDGVIQPDGKGIVRTK